MNRSVGNVYGVQTAGATECLLRSNHHCPSFHIVGMMIYIAIQRLPCHGELRPSHSRRWRNVDSPSHGSFGCQRLPQYWTPAIMDLRMLSRGLLAEGILPSQIALVGI